MADHVEANRGILAGNPGGGLEPFDDTLARFDAADIADAAMRPELEISLDQRREPDWQVNYLDMLRRQPVVLTALARQVVAGAEQRVGGMDAEILHALHHDIFRVGGERPVETPGELGRGMQMDDAWRRALRPEPQRAPQKKVVERRLPFLA